MLLNLLFFNKLLAYSVFLIFEFLNVYIIVLMIKNIIKCKEEWIILYYIIINEILKNEWSKEKFSISNQKNSLIV